MENNVSYFQAQEKNVASTYFNADGQSGQLSKEEVNKISTNAMAIQAGIGAIGTLGGLYYAHKKGKGFWGYVGFALLGGVAFSTVGYLVTLPMRAKLQIDDKNKQDTSNLTK